MQENMHQFFLKHNKTNVTFNIRNLRKRMYEGKYASKILKQNKTNVTFHIGILPKRIYAGKYASKIFKAKQN